MATPQGLECKLLKIRGVSSCVHLAFLAQGLHVFPCFDPLCRFARGLRKDLPAAVAFFGHRITSGPIEAFNNQISRLVHRSCGIANLGYLFLITRAQSLRQI